MTGGRRRHLNRRQMFPSQNAGSSRIAHPNNEITVLVIRLQPPAGRRSGNRMVISGKNVSRVRSSGMRPFLAFRELRRYLSLKFDLHIMEPRRIQNMTRRLDRFIIALVFALLAAGMTLLIASAQSGTVPSRQPPAAQISKVQGTTASNCAT